MKRITKNEERRTRNVKQGTSLRDKLSRALKFSRHEIKTLRRRLRAAEARAAKLEAALNRQPSTVNPQPKRNRK